MVKGEQMGLSDWSQAPEQTEGSQDLRKRRWEEEKVQEGRKKLHLRCTEERKSWRGGLWPSERSQAQAQAQAQGGGKGEGTRSGENGVTPTTTVPG